MEKKDVQAMITKSADEMKSFIAQAFSDFGREFMHDIKAFVRQEDADLVRDMRDFVRQEDAALKHDIIMGIGELIDDGINPQIDALDQRVLKLETKMQS